MMRFYVFFLCATAIVSPLHAPAEPLDLSFQELSAAYLTNPQQYHQKEVQIRGFLYRDADGVVLAAEPNVKSCCLYKIGYDRRLEVSGTIDPQKINARATDLLGVLIVEKSKRPDEKWPYRYRLINASLIEHESPSLKFVLGLVTLFIFTGGFLWYLKR